MLGKQRAEEGDCQGMAGLWDLQDRRQLPAGNRYQHAWNTKRLPGGVEEILPNKLVALEGKAECHPHDVERAEGCCQTQLSL